MGPMELVIVESPTKTKSISKYLGKEYKVVSSKGHIWNLPKSKLGVDVEHGFEPMYEPIRGRGKIVKDLQKIAADADHVFLATDLDREGEAIAFQVALALNPQLLSKTQDNYIESEPTKSQLSKLEKKFRRVVFNQITKDAVLSAFGNPRGFDFNLLDAQKARRVLDRLVGYELSPLLWKKIHYGLSAGRVQSVAVRLIVEREREREKFRTKQYYRIFIKTDGIHGAELVSVNEKTVRVRTTLDLFAGPYTYTSTVIDARDKLERLLSDLRNLRELTVFSVNRKETVRKPYPPHTTASMQRGAATLLGMSSKQTMRIAQSLYENGYITYHRTDSTNLAKGFVDEARKYVEKKFGKQFVPDSARTYRSRSKVAQEAHEAIRPADVSELSTMQSKIQRSKELGEKGAQLYELIWKRAVASQMADAIYDNTTLTLRPVSNQLQAGYLFEAKGTVVKFDGFMKVLGKSTEDKVLPEVEEGRKLRMIDVEFTEHQTSPPPRYNEASLVRDLEKHEIGRPSTYASIIDTIQVRNYVEQEKRQFTPTDTGQVVTDFLIKHFPDIVDLSFTAKMEDDLDAIAVGELKWNLVVEQFYNPFKRRLEQKEKSIEKSDQTTLGAVGEECPDCGRALVYKLGRYGKFISCSGFPDCEYARPYIEKIGLGCPQCGGEQNGEVVIRRTRKGKKFWGCSRYPDCDWASWEQPRG